MKTNHTPFKDLLTIELSPNRDERGSFTRIFCQKSLPYTFVQYSLAETKKRGTLRGMHFQAEPNNEVKLIHCLSGRLFDVVIDLREELPTYGMHFSIELKPGLGLIVPKGFAHGFLTLEDDCSLLYGCSAFFSPESRRGLLWNDPHLGIKWPFKPKLLSEADKQWPLFQDACPTNA